MKKGKGRYTNPISVGDLVLVENETEKRFNWPVARVLELIRGRDGNTRVVKLKTSSGMLTRPVQKLHPLEMANDGKLFLEDDAQISGTVTTRSGRQVKKPGRLEYKN